MRQVSIEQKFDAEKEKCPLEFSTWKSNPEDQCQARELPTVSMTRL